MRRFYTNSFILLFCLLLGLSDCLLAQDTVKTYSYCPSAPVAKDHEGNIYRTVQIGSLCWMAENMRCTTSPSGHRWLSNPTFSSTEPEYDAFYATPLDPRHGMFYNWAAALDLPNHQLNAKPFSGPVRGICPAGWRLPNLEDWDRLFSELGGHRVAGEMMKSPSKMWDPYFSILRDVSGFDAIPAGAYTENKHQYYGRQTFFWCTDNFSRNQAWCCILYDFKNEGYNYLNYKCYGLSVRCVKD